MDFQDKSSRSLCGPGCPLPPPRPRHSPSDGSLSSLGLPQPIAHMAGRTTFETVQRSQRTQPRSVCSAPQWLSPFPAQEPFELIPFLCLFTGLTSLPPSGLRPKLCFFRERFSALPLNALLPILCPHRNLCFSCMACAKICNHIFICLGFSGGSAVKNPSASAGDRDLILGLGRSLGEGNDNPLQYSCLENPMDRESWRATVHEVTKSQT